MRTITAEEFGGAIKTADVAPRVKRELRFEASVAGMTAGWDDYELVAIHDRQGAAGVLVLQPDEAVYLVQYDLAPLAARSTTGRARSIICDFCSTWQRGSNAGSITLYNRGAKRTVRFLCCGDLQCSQHVRSRTEAARISRTQLREHLDDEGRIDRLRRSLTQKRIDLGLEAAGF